MKTGERLDAVRAARPRVHCISNYVTINDCANILLACGALPVMADDPAETAEVAAISAALVINMGTLHRYAVPGMIAAGREANRLGLPVVLDPVGAGMSALRRETAKQLLREVRFTVIRGNRSEIRALLEGGKNTAGVDAAPEDGAGGSAGEERLALALCAATGAVTAISGAEDVLAAPDGRICRVRNGHEDMARITGTGCMLSALMGAFAAAEALGGRMAAAGPDDWMGGAGKGCGCAAAAGPDYLAAAAGKGFGCTAAAGQDDRAGGAGKGFGRVAAVGPDYLAAAAAADAMMGLAGEKAWQKAQRAGGGTGSMRVYLIDAVSRMTGEELEGGGRIACF